MWPVRHWKAILGLFAFIPPICKAAWGAVGNVGSIDFLVTHAHDLGWMGDVIGWILDPPGWSIVPMIGAGLALIWWDAKRPREPRELAHALDVQRGSPEPKPISTGPAVNEKPADGAPRQKAVPLSTSALPILSCSAATVTPPPPEPNIPDWDWSKLYGRSEDGKLIHLRFLPDSSEQRRDAVLLVVYGYKVLRGIEAVKSSVVHREMQRVETEAPNSRLINRMAALSHVMVMLADFDYGAALVQSGYLKRIRLSEGGYYELTYYGEEQAKAQARDLIERA